MTNMWLQLDLNPDRNQQIQRHHFPLVPRYERIEHFKKQRYHLIFFQLPCHCLFLICSQLVIDITIILQLQMVNQLVTLPQMAGHLPRLTIKPTKAAIQLVIRAKCSLKASFNIICLQLQPFENKCCRRMLGWRVISQTSDNSVAMHQAFVVRPCLPTAKNHTTVNSVSTVVVA